MAKTAAEKQAAYRERKADKLSQESPEAIAREAIDPVLPGGPVIEKLDEIVKRLATIYDLIKDMHVNQKRPGEVDRYGPHGPDPADISEPQLEPGMTPVKDLSKCSECGKDLPPVETPRQWSEACQACVWKNAEKRTA